MALVDIGPFREGTIPAALTPTITDSAGTAIVVTGLTVKCMIKRVNATTAAEGAGSVVDGDNGVIEYQWAAADIVEGSWRCVFYAYNAGLTTIIGTSDEYAFIVLGGYTLPAALTA